MQNQFSVGQEKHVTKEDLLKEAAKMRNKSNQMIKARVQPAKIYEHLKFNHRDFALVYPTVLARMALGEYSPAALSKFIDHIVAHPWKDEKGWLEAQALYFKILFKELNPRAPPSEADRMYDLALADLVEESKKFHEDLEAVKKADEARKNMADSEYKEELESWINENRAELLDVLKRSSNK